MFTENYMKYQRYMFSYEPYSGSEEDANLTNPNGDVFAAQAANCAYGGFGGALRWARCQAVPTSKMSAAHSTGYGVYFGTGTTPAAKADYCLESPITSGLTVPSSAVDLVISQAGDGVYTAEATYTLTNTTSETINISEVGVFTTIGKATTEWYPVLMRRDVLAEPISIPAGGAKQLRYKVTFNQTA